MQVSKPWLLKYLRTQNVTTVILPNPIDFFSENANQTNLKTFNVTKHWTFSNFVNAASTISLNSLEQKSINKSAVAFQAPFLGSFVYILTIPPHSTFIIQPVSACRVV